MGRDEGFKCENDSAEFRLAEVLEEHIVEIAKLANELIAACGLSLIPGLQPFQHPVKPIRPVHQDGRCGSADGASGGHGAKAGNFEMYASIWHRSRIDPQKERQSMQLRQIQEL